MSTPIVMPAFPANIPLTSADNVNALLSALVAGGVSIDDLLMSNAIASAKASLENQTNRILAPKRIQRRLDGNGRDRMVLPYWPILCINEVEVSYSYPLGFTRVAHEYDFIIDRPTGTISFPPYTYSLAVQPFAYTFYPSSKNVMVDFTVGFTEQIFGDLLGTIDNATFLFSSPAVKQAINVVPNAGTPPAFSPTIYVNGIAQVNTTYVNASTATTNWQVATDNLVYTLVQSATGGYAGVTFNTALAANAVVTADYSYWFIPDDLIDAATKQAAITILTSLAVAPYGDISTGGMTTVMMDGFKTIANDKGQWGPQISTWHDDIATVVNTYREISFPTGSGYANIHSGWLG